MSIDRLVSRSLLRIASSLVFFGAVLAQVPGNAQTTVSTGATSATAGSTTTSTAATTTGTTTTNGATLLAAGRILNQATFGPVQSDLANVEQIGVAAYVNQQLNMPAYQMPSTVPAADYQLGDCAGWGCFPEAWWWQDILFGQDQLRARVAFALSKLFVVSSNNIDSRYYPSYLNSLSADAFGNWLTLMQDVATSPAMGVYLNALNSLAPAAGQHADENFARENMQLFSIGTVALNQDGSVQTDSNGNPIPTYTPAIIQSFARAFTGYTLANSDCSTPKALQYYAWGTAFGAGCPMVPLDKYHDLTQKTLLRGQVLPAGQGAAADFQAAMLNVFNDPSLPPFVCRRLIQNLVKSNPSPAYISRIAGVFINDGNGVRGNMKAVIKAILLDSEARTDDRGGTPDPATGLMRDPLLQYTSILRSLGATQNLPSPYVCVYHQTFDVWLNNIGENPHAEPSVFSFYSPNYTISGGLYAPEFQLENSYSLSWMMLHIQDLLDNNFSLATANEFSIDLSATSTLGTIASSQGSAALLSTLNALLMHGTMSAAMTSTISTAINGLDPATMVRNAVHLIVTSPQYRIMI